jgi:hypothetical protein
VIVALVVGGCGGREVGIPAAEVVLAPSFATLPDDLAASSQLDAIPERNTAGRARVGGRARAAAA